MLVNDNGNYMDGRTLAYKRYTIILAVTAADPKLVAYAV